MARPKKKRTLAQVKQTPGELDLSAMGLPADGLINHEQRARFHASQKRFCIIPAGRRSGKSLEARFRLIWGSEWLGGNHSGAMNPPPGVTEPIYVYAAPTYNQAKRLAWAALKREVPGWAVVETIESELTIVLQSGAKIIVVGLDKPERLEGIAISGIVLDEFADMKPEVWTSSIRPALSTRGNEGWALFIGRPRGKNHFFKMVMFAESVEGKEDWEVFRPWPSSLILSEDEVRAARRELDDRSFRQEYEGEFIDGAGAAAYSFGEHNHRTADYDPDKSLLFAFDFNVSPGIAAVAQETDIAVAVYECDVCGWRNPGRSGGSCPGCRSALPFDKGVVFIDEVHIPDGSNTRRVCEALLSRWADVHRGAVICYGDASGGSRKSSAERSDWKIIEGHLGAQWPAFQIDVPKGNPPVRDRLVVMNSALLNSSGATHAFFDPARVPRTVEDLLLTEVDDHGGIDPGKDKQRGHLLDAVGYLIHRRMSTERTAPTFTVGSYC